MGPHRHRGATRVVALLLLGCAPAEEGGGGGGGDSAGPRRAAPPVVQVAADVPWGAASGATGGLDRAVAAAGGSARFHLEPGRYFLEPQAWPAASCDGCSESDRDVPATVGLVLSGQGSGLFGTASDSVVIHTGSGIGVLFDSCEGCTLRGVTVTGGMGSAEPGAQTGGVVVRASDVTLQRCRITGNDDPGKEQAGVVVLEGGRIEVLTCRIEGNAGDGIALYGNAEAEVRSTVIDGGQRAPGGGVTPGRGTAVRITTGARAVIEESRIARYRQGIGVHGSARAQIRENVVEEIGTWGIAIQGSGGAPSAFVEDNVVFRAGGCGIVVDAPAAAGTEGSVVRNAVVESGLERPPADDGEPCAASPAALVRRAVPPGWPVQDNLFHGNGGTGGAGASMEAELDLATFLARAMRLYTFEIEPQPATTGSLFMEAYRERFGPPFR